MSVARTPRQTAFIRQFLRNPAAIGAVAPSSTGLAQRMVEWIDWPCVDAVAEYGPGTGVFTRSILDAKRPESDFFAIELNGEFCQGLADAFPDVRVFNDSVANIAVHCRELGIAHLDAVICGLPWAAFPTALQRECLEALRSVLKPGGQFATFAYLQGLLLPAGQRFRRLLPRYFESVETSPVVWNNLPPAFVYRCR